MWRCLIDAVKWCNDVLQPRWRSNNIAKLMRARSAYYVNKWMVILLKYVKPWSKMLAKWWLMRFIVSYLTQLSIESLVGQNSI